ncbi:MAG: S24 family peptidase [Candidatus Cloacimonadota bacterium]|nr:S24 family peptidase [Candidatus Cloacimonadota bacterium]
MSLGERLQILLEELELTQTALAKDLNTSNVVVNRYINNRTNPDYNFLNKLALNYKVNINWLLTGDGVMFGEEHIKMIAGKKYFNIPVVAAVSCGSPEEIQAAEIDDYIMVDSHSLPGDFKEYFAFNASGNSMHPYISHGDVVIVKHSNDWQQADERVCVINYDGEVTLKKVNLFSEGKKILLSPYNTEFSPILLDKDKLKKTKLVGIAVMAVRNL